MFDFTRHFSRISATSAMTAAAAGIFVGIIAPLTGGLPKPYEVREFQAGFTAYMNGETSTPTLEPAYYPRRLSAQVTPRVEAQREEFRLVAARADESALETAEAPRLVALDGGVIPQGEVIEASQTIDASLDMEIEPVAEEPQTEEIIVDIEPDEVKGIES